MKPVLVTANAHGVTAGHSHVPWEMVRELLLCPWRGEVWLEIRTGESTRRRWRVANDDAALLTLQTAIAARSGSAPPIPDVPFSWRSMDGHTLAVHIEDRAARRRAIALGLFGFVLGTSSPVSSAISVYWWPGHELFVGMAIYAITALVLGPSIAVVALRQRPLAVRLPVRVDDDTLFIGDLQIPTSSIRAARWEGSDLVIDAGPRLHRVEAVQRRDGDAGWLIEFLQRRSAAPNRAHLG